MRILWISHTLFSQEKELSSGVWQKSLASEMLNIPNVLLGNIAPNRRTNKIEYSMFHSIDQWAIPTSEKANYAKHFLDILEKFKPDVIHVWGTENFMKLTPFKCQNKVPTILFMQGVLGSIAPLLLKSLSFKEAFQTIGIRELITRNNVFKLQKSFEEEGIVETKMISSTKYIAVQSTWTKSQITHINPNAHYFKVNRALREEFVSSKKWSEFQHEQPIIYTASIGFPLKGTDILLKALAIVKQKFPKVQLRIAGAVGRKDFLAEGYIRHLMKLIKKHDLSSNIQWLGAIDANEIIKNLQESSVFVNPSIIESYSLVLAEAMAVGTPAVVSYAGAMPELAEPNKEALFFTPMDYKNCAYQILVLLNNSTLAFELSNNAIEKTKKRNQGLSLRDSHMKIYEEVLTLSKNEGRL
jgi:glycosyltransferase involved in cell wall biosynthesis